MSLVTNKEELMELRKSNRILHYIFTTAEIENLPYEQTLEVLALKLVKRIDELEEEYLK